MRESRASALGLTGYLPLLSKDRFTSKEKIPVIKIIASYHISCFFMPEGHLQEVRSLSRLVSVRGVYVAVEATMPLCSLL